MISGTMKQEQNTITIRTKFSNYGTTFMNDFIHNVTDKQVVQVLSNSDLWNDESQQRLMTLGEWNKAVGLWNTLNTISFIEQLKETDIAWTQKNVEYYIDKMSHLGIFELMSKDINDDYIDFYFGYGDNVEISCSILEGVSENSKSMALSPYANIAVRGLDYEYECINMVQDKFIIVYE